MFYRNNFKLYAGLLIILVLTVFYIYIFSFANLSKIVIRKNKKELNVDHRSEPHKFDVQQRIAQHLPYLPIEDLQMPLNPLRNYNGTCAWHPNIMDIQFQNEYWQILQSHNITYNIYGAYLDNRPLVAKNETLIRLLSMINLISENSSDYPLVYCQIWFREKFAPTIVPVSSTQFIWRSIWGFNHKYNYPHILTCVLPKGYGKWIPKAVSLVAAPCDKATNNIRVIYRPLKPLEEKKEFAVCIKGLDFPYVDNSYRLVEYMEFLRIMGAQKVVLFDLETHENITKVLNYYRSTGFLEYRPFSFSLKYSNLPELRHLQKTLKNDEFVLHESIAYNDCVYRNMYRYKYIGVWDVDELPIPLGNYTNWQQLVAVAHKSRTSECKSYASLCFLCAYFPKYEGDVSYITEFPDYFYMLQHVERVKEHAKYGWGMKCLHNTDYIVATHNHFPVHFSAGCRDYTFRKTEAQLNHYREPPYKENLTSLIVDKSLWRLGQQAVANALPIFEKLDFFVKF